MQIRTSILCSVLAGVVMAGSPVFGAAYIKFDGIDGEAQDPKHQAWSELLSFSQAIQRPATTAVPGRRRGAAVLEDLQFSMNLDKASPKIAGALLRGQVIPQVEIHVTASYTDAGQTTDVTYYSYELKNVMITSFHVNASGSEGVPPSVTGSLGFEEIKVTYTEFDTRGQAKGSVEYSWKVEEGESAQ